MFQLNKLKRQGSFRALSSYFGAIVQGTTVWTRDNRFIVVLSVGHRWLHHTHFPLACLVEGLNVVSCGQKHVNKWHISESISCLILSQYYHLQSYFIYILFKWNNPPVKRNTLFHIYVIIFLNIYVHYFSEIYLQV